MPGKKSIDNEEKTMIKEEIYLKGVEYTYSLIKKKINSEIDTERQEWLNLVGSKSLNDTPIIDEKENFEGSNFLENENIKNELGILFE